MKHKSETFEKFKVWKIEVKNQTCRKIKCLRSKNGKEYTNGRFKKFFAEHGIKRHYTACRTPQQNGMAERMNRSIAEKARYLRFNARLAKNFWANAVSMACFLINRSPRELLDGKVAEEAWTSNEVDFTDLWVFGCPSYMHIPSEERLKIDPKSK